MYIGVRIGGRPHYFLIASPAGYRWGYGVKLNRGYQSLTPEILLEGKDLLTEFLYEFQSSDPEKTWKLNSDQIHFVENYIENKIHFIDENQP